MDGVAFLPVILDGERLGVQGVKGIAAGDHGSGHLEICSCLRRGVVTACGDEWFVEWC
jgi:hypothetical protein